MKNKILLLTVFIVVISAIVLNNPENKAERFVNKNGEQIVYLIENGEKVDNFKGFKYYYNHSADTVHEFTLSSYGFAPGSKYFGCYYSVNNTPAVYAGAEAELISEGENLWSWQSEGDNHGLTYRIKDNWFYFEASF